MRFGLPVEEVTLAQVDHRHEPGEFSAHVGHEDHAIGEDGIDEIGDGPTLLDDLATARQAPAVRMPRPEAHAGFVDLHPQQERALGVKRWRFQHHQELECAVVSGLHPERAVEVGPPGDERLGHGGGRR